MRANQFLEEEYNPRKPKRNRLRLKKIERVSKEGLEEVTEDFYALTSTEKGRRRQICVLAGKHTWGIKYYKYYNVGGGYIQCKVCGEYGKERRS